MGDVNLTLSKEHLNCPEEARLIADFNMRIKIKKPFLHSLLEPLIIGCPIPTPNNELS